VSAKRRELLAPDQGRATRRPSARLRRPPAIVTTAALYHPDVAAARRGCRREAARASRRRAGPPRRNLRTLEWSPDGPDSADADVRLHDGTWGRHEPEGPAARTVGRVPIASRSTVRFSPASPRRWTRVKSNPAARRAGAAAGRAGTAALQPVRRGSPRAGRERRAALRRAYPTEALFLALLESSATFPRKPGDRSRVRARVS